jgi:uncharacterized protein involved in exopolysaccharide biosynthesis
MPHSVRERLDDDYTDEIDLAALFFVLWGYRKLIASMVFVFVFLVLVQSYNKPRTFTASASIINMVDNSRVIKNVQSFDFDTQVQSPRNSILLAILESETLAERVVNKLDLLPFLYPKKWDAEKKEWRLKFDETAPTLKMGVARMKGSKMVKIKSSENDPTITLSVTTRDAEMSAKIANTYTRELEEYLKTNSFSTVQKSRIFLEGKLEEAKNDLESLKKKLAEFQGNNGVFDLDQQAEASMAAYNELALQLNQKETEHDYIKSISSPMNPRVQNLENQIAAIKNKMQGIKSGGGSYDIAIDDPGQGKGQSFLPLNRVSGLRMQMQKLAHDIEMQQKTYDLLIESYEKITIQEAKDKIFITILDPAQVPIRPDGKRTLIKLFLAVFGGAFLGICLAFVLEFLKKNMEVRFGEGEKPIDTVAVHEPFAVAGRTACDSIDKDRGLPEKK